MAYSKQKTWLPVFEGFYNTWYESELDSMLEREIELSEDEYKEYYADLFEVGITREVFENHAYDYVNWKKAQNDMSSEIANTLETMESEGIVKNINFEKLVSPQYYNFSNDSINCEITYNKSKLLKYLKNNKSEFEKHLIDTYTSCDGFISSYTNDGDYWLDSKNWSEHQVGSILNFVYKNIHEDCDTVQYKLYINCNFELCLSEYLDYDKMITDFKGKKLK